MIKNTIAVTAKVPKDTANIWASIRTVAITTVTISGRKVQMTARARDATGDAAAFIKPTLWLITENVTTARINWSALSNILEFLPYISCRRPRST